MPAAASDHPANILLLSSIGNGGNAASTLDYLAGYAKHSTHKFYYHNFVYDLRDDFDFSFFDAIVIAHNFWPEILKPEQRRRIAEARGLKVLFLQDEYQYVRHINGWMAEMGIELMFTCVDPNDFDTFYPKSRIPSLREVHSVLTGYVSDYLTDPRLRRRGSRRYDIGYRSRVSPYFLGRIGREKLVIAQRFQQLAVENGLSANISVAEADRLYGRNWIRFLQSCRIQLGTPSGSSIVDMDGSLIEAEAAYRAAHPHASFEEVWEHILAPHDGRLVIDTISPRFFEYAATGATMVLHDGHYGGLLEAGRHYIAVKKDYSNILEVLEQVRDRRYCERLADQAHSDLIASGRFSDRAFVQRFDAILATHLPHPRGRVALHADAFYRKQAADHGQVLFCDRNGPQLMKTKQGRALKRRQLWSDLLVHLPLLGSALRRTGGDPLEKSRKGAAAVALARRQRPLGRLLLATLAAPSSASSVRPERLLKDLLLLGIVKCAQSGIVAWGQPFHVAAQYDGRSNRMLLVASPVPVAGAASRDKLIEAGDDLGGFWTDFEDALGAGRVRDIVWDLSRVYPLQKFANTTRLFWSISGHLDVFRSAEDEYYHLAALAGAGRRWPRLVSGAVQYALSPGNGPELQALRRIFT